MWGAIGVGAYWVYTSYFGGSAAVSAAPAGGGAPSPTPTVGSSQMDTWYGQLKAAAAADSSNFSGSGDSLSGSPDHWNYFLNSITGYGANLDTTFGAVGSTGRAGTITAATFWNAVAPGLKSAKGLTGLGFYAGLGSLVRV